MVYKMCTNVELSEVEKACENCEETMVSGASVLVSKMVSEISNVEDSRKLVVELLKITKELGILETIRDIMKGMYSKEADTNE